MFIVLFDVYPHRAQMQHYLDFAKLLRPELEQIPGFIDNERFTNIHNPRHVLSLSTWADEKALIRWRTHAQHHQVQEQGRAVVFADYRLRIGEVTADTLPPHGHQLRQQRFDETETGNAKVLTVLERDPPTGNTVDEQIMRAAARDPEHAPAGWIEEAQFTSISNPGKLVVLAGWNTAEAAHAWHATQIAPINPAGLRSRFVRVIRAYGMHDRSEAPQYYPAVASEAAVW
ncbi:MAG: antibiotic biosynthesis monooxygenase [Roseiflexaceae bacterium]|nr:antibiotic biosynthesis monooxygenase [Roseiflexaceae bacterium]